MDEARKHVTLESATSENRHTRFARLLWFPAAALLAGGLFLGVAPRVVRACTPGDVTAERLTPSSRLASNATTNPTSPDRLDVGEKFTEQTKDHEYRFTLDGSQDMVHLRVSAEVHRGRIEWDLIDPTGKVRTHIGITEHGTMDSADMKTIKGEWLLRIKLEDATGKYDIHWTQ
jgi:hypothetical protein